jgi:DNA-binding MarR family transcriptional regulator
MADINSAGVDSLSAPSAQRASRSLPAPDPRLVTFVELLFFAYRDFTREADAVLAEFGLGRAHHRVLHFVNRSPGLKVAELLDILKITKQSLARVLKELVDQGWIMQKAGVKDRRQRLLHTTPKGAALADRLDGLQARRVAHALAACGAEGADLVAGFLFAMTSEDERAKVEALLPAALGPAATRRA